MAHNSLLFYIVVILGGILVAAALTLPLLPQRRRRTTGWRGVPFVTIGLMVVHTLLFAATVHGSELSDSVAFQFGLVPRSANLWMLFTHMFLHGTWSHLLFNMLFLWLFGPHVEEALGKLEYFLFYLGGGVAAGLLHVILASTPLLSQAGTVPLVGASGAISAILGLFAVRFWRAKVRVFLLFPIPAVFAVGLFVIYQIYQGVAAFHDGGKSEPIAYWAHIGGFLFGVLISIPLKMREESRYEYNLEDAEKAVKDGRLADAADYYRRFLAGRPDDAGAHRALGRVCVSLRQGEVAHRHFMDALRLYLRNSNLPAVAGVYEEACANFETFPLPPAILQRVASACEESRQFPLAIRALSELCRDFPDSREAELGLLRLGRLHLQKLEQPQNAISILSEFLRTYPNSEWASHARQLMTEAESAIGTPLPASY